LTAQLHRLGGDVTNAVWPWSEGVQAGNAEGKPAVAITANTFGVDFAGDGASEVPQAATLVHAIPASNAAIVFGALFMTPPGARPS
jgi:hypothetical protein